MVTVYSQDIIEAACQFANSLRSHTAEIELNAITITGVRVNDEAVAIRFEPTPEDRVQYINQLRIGR